MERWFHEIEEQVNHIITRWDSYPETLDDEPRVLLRPFVEEPPTIELKLKIHLEGGE